MTLAGTWRLVELDGVPLETSEGERRPELVFDLEAQRIAGFGGCNRLAGSFEENGGELDLGPLVTTRMACADEVMERERAFVRALESTTGFTVEESVLRLLAGDEVVARFEASGREPHEP